MLESPRVKKEKQQIIPSAMHIDGSARLQSVSETQDSKYHKLITEFYKLTGVPIVLNTSFNSREPIVETPADALFTFLSTELDYLVIEDYLVMKDR
jgi:carbamoyltransferase